jgi:hypothetical protein
MPPLAFASGPRATKQSIALGGSALQSAAEKRRCDLDYFIEKLSDFVEKIDWSSSGPMQGFGGAGGASKALELLRHTRKQTLGNLRIYDKQEYSVN